MILNITIHKESFWLNSVIIGSTVAFGWLLADGSKGTWTTAHSLASLFFTLSFLLIWLVQQLRKQPPQKIIKGEDPQHVSNLERRIQSLQWQVELLTALREMSRVVSDAVDFEKMMTEVFVIIDGLFNSESITLFILDETEKLVPTTKK